MKGGGKFALTSDAESDPYGWGRRGGEGESPDLSGMQLYLGPKIQVGRTPYYSASLKIERNLYERGGGRETLKRKRRAALKVFQ